MKRRNFLKGLAAAAALSLSRLVPDLAPVRERATRWRIVISDPLARFDRNLFVEHWAPRADAVFMLDEPHEYAKAFGLLMNDRLKYGGEFYRIEAIA